MASYKEISKNFSWGADFAGGDSLSKISTNTASSDSVVNITSGIDSTYNVYYVVYNAIHPSAGSKLTCQFTTNGSDFNLTLCTAQCNGSNTEGGSASNNNADASEDQNDGTAYQSIAYADTIETNADVTTVFGSTLGNDSFYVQNVFGVIFRCKLRIQHIHVMRN